MKTANRAHGVFTSKLSSILSKFKDSSTVHVGHEQLKSFFNEFALRDIIVPFITKMDTSDQLSDRQKKQYPKAYISLMECFKEQILLEQFFQKIMQSLNKKPVGVSEVISVICKTLLNRIQNPEHLYPYVSAIMNIFRCHNEIAKILKQLIEIIDPSVISAVQEEIIVILYEKINNAKSKSDFLDSILALVLNLQENLTVETQINGFLAKYLKNDDWNCRKLCVDIGNALLIINHQISQSIHSIIKELKYDKIKHVRDSVNNYEVLYKQTFGQEVPQKPIRYHTSIRDVRVKPEQDNKFIAKSPAPMCHKETPISIIPEKSNSLEKSIKLKKKNENFFKNAKNSDVIRVSEHNHSCIIEGDKPIQDLNENVVQMPQLRKTLQLVNEKANNFEAYLKTRTSPKVITSPKDSARQKQANKKEFIFNQTKNEQSKIVLKFNYQNQFQNFKKKNRPVEMDPLKIDSYRQACSFSSDQFKGNQSFVDFSLGQIKQQSNYSDQLIYLFKQFEKKVNDRLNRFEQRIQALERDKNTDYGNSKMLKARVIVQKQVENIRQNSPKSFYYSQMPNESQWQSSIAESVESNIEEKVRVSVLNENWDEAFTLALTNNKRNILLNLFERCAFPSDKTVEQCILLELKKLLGYTSALKWLKFYLTEKTMSVGRLIKLKQQLQKRGQGDSKNYEMLKQLVLNEIEQKINVLK